VPIVQSLMDNLLKRYGPEEGKRVYYAMEAEGKGPFAPGGKYRHLHEAFAERNGVPPSHATRAKKKPAPSKKGRARATAKRKRR
jgi:hypothetical protein